VSGPFDNNLRTILDAITDGVYVTTSDREIVFWNRGAERITGYSADEVIGSHCYDNILVHTDLNGRQLCFDGCPLQNCMESGVGNAVSEVFLKRKDGERLAVYVKTAVFQDAGRVYGVEVFGELESVAGAELARRVQDLSDSAVTESLTGLFNRRYFDAALDQHFALFQRLGTCYGVLYADIDHFKAFNDTFGHRGGDEAIKFVADVISRAARRMDTVTRYGGDEFAVLCSVASREELRAYGERLVELVRGSVFALSHRSGIDPTLSVGATLVSPADADARAALERADAAMYRAKHDGGNGFAIITADEGANDAGDTGPL
jgi:diguanylate cyclase (GGDEF)-like protein/PAS domain S-box-containing protein